MFYDVGSGSGRGVFAAAFLHDFDKCVGIEILDGLHVVPLRAVRVCLTDFLFFCVMRRPNPY